MRKLTALPLVLVLAAAPLAACGGGDDAKKPNCSGHASGATSDAVKVSGAFGRTGPKATFATPLSAEVDDLQRTVVDTGQGEDTAQDDQIEAVISVFNGRTGEPALSEQATLTVGDENTFEAFRAGVECVPTGSRVVTTVIASDVYGEEGYAELGIKATDSLVIVTDVVDVREEVEAKPWKKDVPEVSLKGDVPDVTLPDTAPPKDVLVKVLTEGRGEKVAAGDTVTAHYQLRTWEDGGKVSQQTFGKDSQPAELPTDQVVQGFKAGIVGQRVGSTVLISVPATYGFGAEESEDDELSGKTLLFVVEIVSITS